MGFDVTLLDILSSLKGGQQPEQQAPVSVNPWDAQIAKPDGQPLPQLESQQPQGT